MGGWADGVDGWVDGGVDGWVDEGMDGLGGWMDA